MADGGSFYGAPSAPGRRPDKLAAVAVVLVVVGIAYAVARPWGDAGQPALGVRSERELPPVSVADDAKSAAGVAKPSDGRPVYEGLRPDFTWPKGQGPKDKS